MYLQCSKQYQYGKATDANQFSAADGRIVDVGTGEMSQKMVVLQGGNWRNVSEIGCAARWERR
jgi:hypothetical protein